MKSLHIQTEQYSDTVCTRLSTLHFKPPPPPSPAGPATVQVVPTEICKYMNVSCPRPRRILAGGLMVMRHLTAIWGNQINSTYPLQVSSGVFVFFLFEIYFYLRHRVDIQHRTVGEYKKLQ